MRITLIIASFLITFGLVQAGSNFGHSSGSPGPGELSGGVVMIASSTPITGYATQEGTLLQPRNQISLSRPGRPHIWLTGRRWRTTA